MRILETGAIYNGSAPSAASEYYYTQNCTTYPILNCKYISDTWGVDYAVTWGIAPER